MILITKTKTSPDRRINIIIIRHINQSLAFASQLPLFNLNKKKRTHANQILICYYTKYGSFNNK